MKKNCFIKGIAFYILLLFLSLKGVAGASIKDVRFSDLVLQKDAVNGLELEKSDRVGDMWPVVEKLPKYMEKPEKKSASGPVVAKPLEMAMKNYSGVRQEWVDKKRPRWKFTVKYGEYRNKKQARDALLMLVYRNSSPVYDTRYAGAQSPENPLIVVFAPECRKLDLGDLGYWTSVRYGGGVTSFVVDRFIFFIYSPYKRPDNLFAPKILEKIRRERK